MYIYIYILHGNKQIKINNVSLLTFDMITSVCTCDAYIANNKKSIILFDFLFRKTCINSLPIEQYCNGENFTILSIQVTKVRSCPSWTTLENQAMFESTLRIPHYFRAIFISMVYGGNEVSEEPNYNFSKRSIELQHAYSVFHQSRPQNQVITGDDLDPAAHQSGTNQGSILGESVERDL